MARRRPLRSALLYLAALAAAATAVFFAAYLLGSHPSLEAELERLTTPRAPVPQKSQGIRSLRPAEPPPEPAPEPAQPEGRSLGEGIRARTAALAEPGIMVLADLETLAAASGGGASFLSGIAAFLAQPPAVGRVGLRSLAGAPGACGSTLSVKPCGRWQPGELQGALASALERERGPRNAAGAVAEAAADLEAVPGERAIVIVAGGPDACGADLCGAAVAGGVRPPRVHVVALAPAPSAGEGAPGAALPAEPAWAAPYRCLAERTGGTFAVATAAEDVEHRLRAVARSLEAAVTVHALHLRGEEVQGLAPDGGPAWGASLTSREDGPGAGAEVLSSALPAGFAVPAGTWDLRCWFGGLERKAAVAVAPGERAEVSLTFVTGELFVQARDAGGGEIAGDSAGFGCGWGAEVRREAEEKPVASTCSIPARFELPPGEYGVRVRWKGKERTVEGVTVEGGESTVRAVDFGEGQE